MVAPAYAETRRELANKSGLGRKRKPEDGGEQATPKAPRERPTKSS